MTRTLYIMQGVPGSGKSTVARQIAAYHSVGREETGHIFSTDEFWGTEYNFNPDNLGAAHRWNMQRVLKAMQENHEYIIVDNTNITRKEARPYVQFARAFGYTVQVIRVTCSIEEAIERQRSRPWGRRVPAEKIREMAEKMQDLTEEL